MAGCYSPGDNERAGGGGLIIPVSPYSAPQSIIYELFLLSPYPSLIYKDLAAAAMYKNREREERGKVGGARDGAPVRCYLYYYLTYYLIYYLFYYLLYLFLSIISLY